MKLLLTVFVALWLSACASPPTPADYRGPDAGHVVLGIGAADGTRYNSYSLLFRKTGSNAEKHDGGRFIYYQNSMWLTQKPDYQSDAEEGVVLIASMPPGEYEIYNFSVFFNNGLVEKTFSSRAPLSIPFAVRSGEVVYLGNFQANAINGRNIFRLPIQAGAVFAVESRRSQDMEIARNKDRSLPQKVTDSTSTVERIANPLFVHPLPKAPAVDTEAD